MLGRVIASAGLAAAVLACSRSQRRDETTVAARSINEVLAAHTDSLMAIPGVVGTAIGLCGGERCIKVLVADSSAATATRAKIPARLERYPVSVEVVGTVRPR